MISRSSKLKTISKIGNGRDIIVIDKEDTKRAYKNLSSLKELAKIPKKNEGNYFRFYYILYLYKWG